MKLMSPVAVALIAMLATSPAHAKRFAIRCVGKAVVTHGAPGMAPRKTEYDVDDVYVIDEEAKTLQRALFPRQEYDKLCFGSLSCDLDASPGLIQYSVRGVEYDTDIDYYYKFDRTSGKATIRKSGDSVDGRFPNLWEETLMCEPAEIPVFDTSKNKF